MEIRVTNICQIAVPMKASILTLALALQSVVSSAFAADRVALVIGNDAYQHARKLNAAVNDATAVAAALKKLDFNVISRMNAGEEEILEALGELKDAARRAESVVVYYAGHGIESGGVNYLVPVDAKLEREIQLKTQAVSLDDILAELKAINVPARMVILDCCRDNPLEGRSWLETRSAGGAGLAALAQDTLAEATLVVYSASPGKPALDRVNGGDAHSPFTASLLEQLPKPGVHSFEMFGLVEDGVIKRTGGRQAPRIFYNGSTQPFRNFRFAEEEPPAPQQDTSALPPAAPEPAPVVPSMPPPAPAPAPEPMVAQPSLPVLPASGYFEMESLYADGPYASFNSYSRSQILRRVQQKLKDEGLYASTVDGAVGPGTQRAIITWQQARGMTVSGKLDEATLRGMGLEGIDQMNPPAPRTEPRPKPTVPRQTRPARDDFFRDT